jgi:hypothetical protein
MRYLSILLVFIVSCNMKKNAPQNTDERSQIIAYLKSEYKIDPQVNRFDTLFRQSLIDSHISLDPDSLINSNLTIVEYKPLHLNFIKYMNWYSYKGDTTEECFNINLIEDENTGKFYLNSIDANACSYDDLFIYRTSSVSNKIDTGEQKKLTKEDISAFESIKSFRGYEDNEIKPVFNREGIANYFNDAFRYRLPTKETINNLFSFYDTSICHNSDPKIIYPEGLFKYFASELGKIKNDQYKPYNQKVYLKEQINLLLLKGMEYDSTNNHLWIYEEAHGLRARTLNIRGDSTSGFTYFTDEYRVYFN